MRSSLVKKYACGFLPLFSLPRLLLLLLLFSLFFGRLFSFGLISALFFGGLSFFPSFGRCAEAVSEKPTTMRAANNICCKIFIFLTFQIVLGKSQPLVLLLFNVQKMPFILPANKREITLKFLKYFSRLFAFIRGQKLFLIHDPPVENRINRLGLKYFTVRNSQQIF
jgi:hypothetical protein